MSETLFLLDDLTPGEALSLLADGARQHGGLGFETIRAQLPESAFGLTATLLVPDPFADQARANLQALIEDYRQRTGREPVRSTRPEETMDLATASALLVCHEEGETALKTDEYLLVFPSGDREKAATLLEALLLHATHTRISAAEMDSGPCFLFHVRDDQQRRSSFQAALAGDLFADCILLDGYVASQKTLFFHDSIRPGEAELNDFVSLLLHAPGLTGLDPHRNHHDLLVALHYHRGGDGPAPPRLFLLSGLAFHSQIDFAPVPDHLDLEIQDLKTSQAALSDLKEALAVRAPGVGYRLELRPTRMTVPLEVERVRLQERMAELEYRLAWLDSVSRSRPILLRFPQETLPALAEILRGFSPDVIRQGLIQYAFQSSEGVGGIHYLLIDPNDAVSSEPDPLLLWDDAEIASIRFWLDPLWARYYHGEQRSCLIFVPEGHALFPSMHDWERDDMDSYMRRTVKRWFHDQAEIPANPIYVFEGQARPGGRLTLGVLDQDRFQPLHTRIGWLNDNLAVMRTIESEQFVRSLADAATREQLAQRIHDQSDAVFARFEETVRQTGRQIASQIQDLMKVFDEETERIYEETYETSRSISRLESGLKNLTRVRKDMELVTREAGDHIEETTEKTEELSEELKALEKKLNEAVTSRRRVGKRVVQELKDLRTLHDDLKQRFYETLRLKS